ncbi:MAG: hypothetical protein QHH06_08780 [Clostridiales bacterium]|jgi:ABC-type glycerol-3-phosphate transport system substrate-binding protein|nr:hypothetical protein [Eubacteriales bacterium]MDH7566559.1 hypothetical protein [Clostridiales bacterium]
MKKLALILIILAAVAVLAACSPIKKSTAVQSSTQGREVTVNNAVNHTTEAGGQPGESTGNTDGTAAGTGNDSSIKASGKYVGEIDGHSVEIVADGKPEAYIYNESLSSAIQALNEDDNVIFTYVKNEYGQKVLTKIEVGK